MDTVTSSIEMDLCSSLSRLGAQQKMAGVSIQNPAEERHSDTVRLLVFTKGDDWEERQTRRWLWGGGVGGVGGGGSTGELVFQALT